MKLKLETYDLEYLIGLVAKLEKRIEFVQDCINKHRCSIKGMQAYKKTLAELFHNKDQIEKQITKLKDKGKK